jgi:hypothetical protein
MANIALTGSERVAMPGARVVAPADPTERLEVTILVRRRSGSEFHARAAQLAAKSLRHGMAPMPLIWRRCAPSPRRRDLWWCWNMRPGEP